jgi:hypothetical protein
MNCILCGDSIYPIHSISNFCAKCFIKTKKVGPKPILNKNTFKSNNKRLLYKGGVIK